MTDYTNSDYDGNLGNGSSSEYIESLYARSAFIPITDEEDLRQIMAQAENPKLRLDLPFFGLYKWMYDERGLDLESANEREVYAFLYTHRDQAKVPGKINQQFIADELRFSLSTVKRAIRKLVERGYIRRIEAKKGRANGSIIFGPNAYEILQEPINKAIAKCSPTDGTCLKDVESFFISDDGNIIPHKYAAGSGEEPGSTKPQDSPEGQIDPRKIFTDVENSKPQDSPEGQIDPRIEKPAPDGSNRTPEDTCGNDETAKTDSAPSTCENVTNPQDSSLIDSHYREDEEEEEEEDYIQGLGGVTSGTSRDYVVGTVRGGQDVTGAVAIPCPSPAVSPEGSAPVAGEESGTVEPSDPLAADRAFGLTVVESKAFRALVASSRKTAAHSPESIRRARIAFRERLADGWTPRQLVKAYKFYVLKTYENVKPGTLEERKQSRYEKFPATWLSSASDVALWDRTAGGNGLPEGACALRGQASNAINGPAFPSDGTMTGRPVDGAANETVVHGATVKIMRIAGGWCYRDRFKTFCDLGRGTENLTREQALALAASKVEAQFQSTPAYSPATIEQVASSGRSDLASSPGPIGGSAGGGAVRSGDR